MHVAVSLSSILPPSLPGLAQLLPAPAKPVLLFLAPALPGGRAWVPLLSESAQRPAKRGKNAAASRALWLRNSPALELPGNGGTAPLESVGLGRAGVPSRDPHWACPHWGQEPRGHSSILRGPFVLRDFCKAGDVGEGQIQAYPGAALGKVELWFLWQEVGWR